jgi:hypothetical protein
VLALLATRPLTAALINAIRSPAHDQNHFFMAPPPECGSCRLSNNSHFRVIRHTGFRTERGARDDRLRFLEPKVPT